MRQELGFEVHVGQSQADAVERVREALKREEKLREKLGVEFRPYTILGACNPALAHKALSSRPDVGLLLPCNVTVEAAAGGGSTVRITDPLALLSMGEGGRFDEALDAVATDARERLARVAAELAGAGA